MQGISVEPRHAVAPSPISIFGRMPNPWPTPIQEPSRNAWLVSGLTAQVRERQYWHMCVIADAYTDGW